MRVCVLSFTALAAALLAGCGRQQAQNPMGPPVVPVAVSKATQQTVPFEVRVIGTVESSAIIQVKSQVAGQLVRTHFTEGQNVSQGELLAEIDSRPFKEALRQAEAALAKDRAQLRQSEATLARDTAQAKNGDAEAARATQLSKAGVMSREQYEQVLTSADVYRQSVRATEAAIESARAAIESDLAAIDKAKLDISYCEIRAPISGRTGNLLVFPGNIVKANEDALVVIHRIAPIFTTFSVPEEHLETIRRLAARRALPVRVSLQENSDRDATGKLAVIDNTVDPNTGTIKLKAVLDNRDGLLWPGQFVNVVLTLDTIQNATVVPAEAVQAGQQGQFVYVVKPDNSVEPRLVVPGRVVAGNVVIQKGVNPGESIVTDGQMRLFPGARIRAVDSPAAGKTGL